MRTTIFIFLLLPSLILAQNQWSVDNIPEELLENANSILRDELFRISAPEKDKIVLSMSSITTVMNKKGNPNVHSVIGYDEGMKIRNAEAIIYDANGKEIKRFKQKELKDRSAVDGGTLYSDDRVMYVSYYPEEYPFTIKFSYELEDQNTGFIPNWIARRRYYHSIQNRQFEVEYDPSLELKYKVFNDPDGRLKIEEATNNVKIQVQNLTAIEPEEQSPYIANINPQVMFAFNNFQYEGLDGRATDWTSLGKWEYENLIQGLDEIPNQTKIKIDQLVAGSIDTKEKVKRIYEYVQNNTRYISVQLGIGGLRPYSAETVDELGYGDCKGLTNYTMALLKSQGIESHYAEVYAGSKKSNIQKEFASIQGNHVILNVPLENEELWLECTSKTLPFNFLGDFTDDRDVLVLKPEGGEIKHTHIYKSEGNKLSTIGTVEIDILGNLNVEVELKSNGIQYDSRYPIESLKSDEKDEAYKEYWHYINNMKINSMEFNNDKENIEFTEDIEFECESYVSFVGEDMMFPINILNRLSHIPKRYKNRTQPLQIGRGFVDNDSITIKVPPGYALTEIPNPLSFESEFGSYFSKLQTLEDGNLIYVRTYSLNDGTYPKEKYSDYRSFLRKVARSDNKKIILTKI